MSLIVPEVAHLPPLQRPIKKTAALLTMLATGTVICFIQIVEMLIILGKDDDDVLFHIKNRHLYTVFPTSPYSASNLNNPKISI